MGSGYLIDTNAVIDYLDGKLPVQGMLFMNDVVNAIPNISVITKIEILGYKHSESKIAFIQEFIDASIVFDLDDNIVNETIELRKVRKIKTPDAIIASTAKTYGLILITRNVSDFANIRKLNLVDPYSIGG